MVRWAWSAGPIPRTPMPHPKSVTRQRRSEPLWLPAQHGPGTLGLLREIDRRLAKPPALSYADAFIHAGTARPDLAALYLAESRGAKPLPGRPPDHPAAMWTTVGRLYAALPDEVRTATLPPIVVRHWFMRDQPVYYVDDDGTIIGSGGDRLLARHARVTDLGPPYMADQLVRVAINLAWSSREIQRAITALLRARPPEARGHRHRYTSPQIAQIIRWYYLHRSGRPLKLLAIDAAIRARRRKGAAEAGTAAAVAQATRRIRAGLRWFDAQFARTV